MVPVPTKTATEMTLTTGGGARTLTAAEVLGGLLIVNCDDAQTATLPTATLLNAALPGAASGAAFDLDVINTGDTTLTIAVGTGGTLEVDSGASKDTVATIVANASKRFTILVTGVTQQGDSSDGYTVYGHGSIGAATA
jgi:hypothetical protein